ncbi:hypothetical protein [Streptomyces sp. NPDC053048]|uniref:hypothetical protein n=1 Tax=Streptomyces sp. NPDC053048 TaxID=3365694 RepID=UPI0037CD311C
MATDSAPIEYPDDPEAEAYEAFYETVQGIYSAVVAQRCTDEEGWPLILDALVETRRTIESLRESAKRSRK